MWLYQMVVPVVIQHTLKHRLKNLQPVNNSLVEDVVIITAKFPGNIHDIMSLYDSCISLLSM